MDDDLDDDKDDSDSEFPVFITETCDQVRAKINKLINSGEMKVTHFQRECKISPPSYHSFMKLKGPEAGSGNNTFAAAFRFFEKRRKNGVREPSKKKVKKNDEAKKLDVSGVKLDGEEHGSIPVYDTCDEIRRKIAAYLRNPNVTKAGFNRELAKGLPEGTNLQVQGIDNFQRKKGPMAGNTSRTYYAAYVFFEKQRIQLGKPKSKHRLHCEAEWPNGVETSHLMDRGFLCGPNERPVLDKWGKVSFQTKR